MYSTMTTPITTAKKIIATTKRTTWVVLEKKLEDLVAVASEETEVLGLEDLKADRQLEQAELDLKG